MHPQIVKKLFEKREYYEYLKQNSKWVKILRNDPSRYNDFIKFIKEKYKLRLSDKIEGVSDKIGLITEVLNTLK